LKSWKIREVLPDESIAWHQCKLQTGAIDDGKLNGPLFPHPITNFDNSQNKHAKKTLLFRP
jgi:hypothetical protein